MAPKVPDSGIVLYHYHASPYARRVVSYLALRGIPYAECLQGVVMPRPDLDALGVMYRRIPILSVGKDLYCDTRLIIRKLDQLFPNSTLAVEEPDQRAVQRLIERWVTDGGVFSTFVGLMRKGSDWTVGNDFDKDRSELLGRPFRMADIEKWRPDAIAAAQNCFDMLETGLLADEREWILKTDNPTLADLEAVWPFSWAISVPNMIPPEHISESIYPKTYAYIRRFEARVKQAKQALNPRPVRISGPEALAHVESAQFVDNSKTVDPNDPSGLKEGERVYLIPKEYGSKRRDTGTLVALNADEIAVRAKTSTGADIDIHMPRWGARAVRIETSKI